MARKSVSRPVTTNRRLSAEEINRGLGRLEKRVNELRAFDVGVVPEGTSPELTALSTAIRDTLDRCFGEGSAKFERFEDATDLNWFSGFATNNYPQRHHYQEGVKKNITRSVALLQEAQRTLREDLTDLEYTSPAAQEQAKERDAPTNKVFVVHGHDEGARETVARFLEQIGFEPVILHEQANRGRTVIEKIEAHGDVDFAVVLLTPDDEGRAVRGGELEPRARQNVLLELGYFIGRLGRARVCALKRGQVEIPSDFAGVVWEPMDDGTRWKQALGRELQDAGHPIDWNRVMAR